MALDDFFAQTATIRAEPTPVPRDRLGGADRTGEWQAVAEGVPCLVRPLSAALQTRDDARRNVTLYRIYFAEDPVSGGIGTRHRVVVGQTTYQVTGVVDANSLGRLLHVDCEAIKGS